VVEFKTPGVRSRKRDGATRRHSTVKCGADKEAMMAKFKVVIEREECIACENCISSCPDTFQMADDGLAELKGAVRVGSNDELGVDDLGCTKEAAEACPVTIIHIYEGSNAIV
jgi:ferredoxin